MAAECEGRTAVVTGAAQGLGAAVCRLLLAGGARVHGGDIDEAAAVSPGAIAVERAHRDGWLDRCIPRIPLGRIAEPEDIAEVVLFLASGRNRFMTGETVIASGGEIMD